MPLVSNTEIVLAVRFRVPPGTPPERAAQMLASGGVNLPLSLVGNVMKIDVAVVNAGEPFTVSPPEDGVTPNLKLQ